MKSYNLLDRVNMIKYDSISKLNIYKKKKKLAMFNIKKLKFLTILDSSDKLFYKKLLLLYSVLLNWFGQKTYVYKIINKKNMRKNMIFFHIGCTINKLKVINYIVNYLNNIMKFESVRIDNNLKLDYYNTYVIYKFNNLNYLLGFNNVKYFNVKMEYNLIIVYNKGFKNQITNNNTRLFYEKTFFL